MFSQLKLSDRQDYNPTNFCKAYKDHEGNSVNIAIQQDAVEFMHVFFDKIENCLKQTKQKYLMQTIFSGKNISMLTCHQCGDIKCNYEGL